MAARPGQQEAQNSRFGLHQCGSVRCPVITSHRSGFPGPSAAGCQTVPVYRRRVEGEKFFGELRFWVRVENLAWAFWFVQRIFSDSKVLNCCKFRGKCDDFFIYDRPRALIFPFMALARHCLAFLEEDAHKNETVMKLFIWCYVRSWCHLSIFGYLKLTAMVLHISVRVFDRLRHSRAIFLPGEESGKERTRSLTVACVSPLVCYVRFYQRVF